MQFPIWRRCHFGFRQIRLLLLNIVLNNFFQFDDFMLFRLSLNNEITTLLFYKIESLINMIYQSNLVINYLKFHKIKMFSKRL